MRTHDVVRVLVLICWHVPCRGSSCQAACLLPGVATGWLDVASSQPPEVPQRSHVTNSSTVTKAKCGTVR